LFLGKCGSWKQAKQKKSESDVALGLADWWRLSETVTGTLQIAG